MDTRRSRAQAVLIASLLGAACAPASDEPRSGRPAPPGLDSAAVTVLVGDSLQVALDVRSEGSVRFMLQVRNVAPRQVALLLRGRSPTLDVEVRRAGGEIIWRRLEGEVVQAIVQVRVLEPGEVLQVAAEWDRRLSGGGSAAPGAYEAAALLLLEEGGLAAPVTRFGLGG